MDVPHVMPAAGVARVRAASAKRSARSGGEVACVPRLLVVGGEDHALRIPFLVKLAAHGFEIAAAGSGDAEPFRARGIAHHSYDLDRFLAPLHDWRAWRQLAQIIRVVEPDVVLSFDTKPALLVPVAARAAGAGRVARTINGLGWVFSATTPRALALRPVFKALHALTDPLTAMTIFQNRSDEKFFKASHITRGRSHLIPGSGVEIARFSASGERRAAIARLRCELQLGDAPVVLTVARLARIKGIATLLEAAAIVHRERPDVRFLLAGGRAEEGPDAVSERELAVHARYVHVLGRRSDIADLLALAEVFAFPTELCEGVPRVLLEAALAGTPIVTTRMPGCTDVVEHGVSGLVCEPRRPGELASAILRALDESGAMHAMALRASEWVAREFNLDVTVERYAAVLRDLVDTERARSTDERATNVTA